MKQRLLICILIAIPLLIYSMEWLPFDGGALERTFAYSWLLFAFFCYKRKLTWAVTAEKFFCFGRY